MEAEGSFDILAWFLEYEHPHLALEVALSTVDT